MYFSKRNENRAWSQVSHSATRIMFTFISLSAVQHMPDFIYLNTCHFHYDRVYYELTMTCSPVGLISPVDRALRLVIAKDRARFLITSFFNRLGCSFRCEQHVLYHVLSTVQNIIYYIYFNSCSLFVGLIFFWKTLPFPSSLGLQKKLVKMNSVFNHYLSQYLAINATLTKLLHPLVLYKYIKLLSSVPVCVCVF